VAHLRKPFELSELYEAVESATSGGSEARS
jgi:hypothetical protein